MGEEWDVYIHTTNILNSNDRKHWGQTKDIKQALRTLGAAQARKLPRFNRVRMDVEVSYPDGSLPDCANLVPTMKTYLDGMVSPNGRRKKADGILQDDADKFLLGPFLTPSYWPSPRPGWYLFHVRLTEIEPWVQPPKPEYLGGGGPPPTETRRNITDTDNTILSSAC